MYLFNEKGKAIEVYQMVPHEREQALYRQRELKSIPLSERYYYATTLYSKHLIEDKDTFTMDDLNYQGTMPPRFFKISHTFKPQQFSSGDNAQVTRSYVNGAFGANKAIKVLDGEKELYFILPKNHYYYHEYANEYWMIDIIRVPESLYLLQLLNQGNFEAVVSSDIDEQLGMYEVGTEPVKTLDIATLEQMYDVGLVPGSFDEMMGRVSDTEEILKRVRKVQGSR